MRQGVTTFKNVAADVFLRHKSGYLVADSVRFARVRDCSGQNCGAWRYSVMPLRRYERRNRRANSKEWHSRQSDVALQSALHRTGKQMMKSVISLTARPAC